MGYLTTAVAISTATSDNVSLTALDTDNQLYDLLTNIEYSLWFIDGLTLYLLYRVAKQLRGRNSSLLTMAIVQTLAGLMIGYTATMERYIEANPGFNATVDFFWYMGFTAFFIVGIRALRTMHELTGTKIGSLARYISVYYVLAGCLQVITYADRHLNGSNEVMGRIYETGVPTLNVAATIVCFVFALFALYVAFYRKNKLEGLRWVI